MGGDINNFYDLETWKVGHELVLDIYRLTINFPPDERYGITSQLRRAASSITANIAEGFARYHFNDKIRFYHQSRGSVAEVQNFIILCKDLGYIHLEQCKKIGEKTKMVEKLVNGLIRSIEKQK